MFLNGLNLIIQMVRVVKGLLWIAFEIVEPLNSTEVFNGPQQSYTED